MAASMSGFSDEDASPLSDINVTPLVDVVLVLLIVFMITVPSIVGSARVKVDLPESTAIAADSELLRLVFSLKRNEAGQPVLYLNESPIDEAGVRGLFKEQGKPTDDQPVSLSAEKGMSYAEVIKVVDLLQSVGLKKLSLDTKHVE